MGGFKKLSSFCHHFRPPITQKQILAKFSYTRQSVHNNQFCPSVSQSAVKNFEISTFTMLKDWCTWQWHGRDQSSSLFCTSSSFLFNVGIVHHAFWQLDTVETGHMLTPSTCSHSPTSSFPVLQKAWQGLGMRQHIRLGTQVSDIRHVIKTRMLLHGVDEDSQLLHGAGQLLYGVHLLTASGGVAGSTSSVGKYKNPLIFHPYNQL